MGRDKSLLPHPRGGTFWRYAVDRMEPLCVSVCLSRSGSSLSTPDTERPYAVIEDEALEAGPCAGVAAALQYAMRNHFPAILVTPVDMPFLTTDDLRPLCHQWQNNHHQLVVGMDHDGRRLQPLVAIYPVKFATELTSLADGKDRSLYRWLTMQSPVTVPLSPTACRNINTPEDLQRGSEFSL